jgi:hypothetical protein
VSNQIWASVITAGATVLTALINTVGSRKVSSFVKIPAFRHEEITGMWIGTQEQKLDTGGFDTAKVSVKFLARGKKVLGEGEVVYSRKRQTSRASFKFEGDFRTESFLLLNYQNIDKSKIQFGVWIVRLSSNGLDLSGDVLGYGIDSDKIVPALVKLSKQNPGMT